MKVQVMGPEGALLPPIDVVNHEKSGILASFADDGEPVPLPEVDKYTFALVHVYMATGKVKLEPGEEEDKVLKAATYLEVYPLVDHINGLKRSRVILELQQMVKKRVARINKTILIDSRIIRPLPEDLEQVRRDILPFVTSTPGPQVGNVSGGNNDTTPRGWYVYDEYIDDYVLVPEAVITLLYHKE